LNRIPYGCEQGYLAACKRISGRDFVRKPKPGASALAAKRHRADLKRKKVTAGANYRGGGLDLEINFERVAQLRALPKAEQ
jgi:hypothetical protein